MQHIDGASIPYDSSRTLDCRAINAPDDLTPFNFLDYYNYSEATERAKSCAEFVAKTVLHERSATIENALEMPQADAVFNYVANTLGMQPIGRLAYVSTLDEATSSGLTVYRSLTSYVIKDKIEQDFGGSYDAEGASFLNGFRAATVGAHELAHLAGAQDRMLFALDPQNHSNIIFVDALGSTLQLRDGTGFKGAYLEEGLGSLVGSMYAWARLSKSAQVSTVTQYRSSKGVSIAMPNRIKLAGHQKYIFAALGIERLVDAEPEVWDILMASRRYGQRSEVIRNSLQQRIDRKMPGLFEIIDTTDVDNLDHIMETTERVQFEVHKHVGHMQ
jgi:hypothetical protein